MQTILFIIFIAVFVLSGDGTKGFSHTGVVGILERENIPGAAIVGADTGGIDRGRRVSGCCGRAEPSVEKSKPDYP